MTKNSYPLKLIFLLKRLKRFHFLNGTLETWLKCLWFGVAAKLLKEMWFKKKLLNYPDIQEAALGPELFLLMQITNTAPLVLTWQHGGLHGPWVLLAISNDMSGKKSGRWHIECSAQSELAVRVTEIMLEVWSPPTFLFLLRRLHCL